MFPAGTQAQCEWWSSSRQLHNRASSREQVTAKMKLYTIPSLGKKSLDSIRREDVQAAVRKWAEFLAPSRVKVTCGYLAAMFKAAVLDGKLQKSPRVDPAV
jgi:hypothetical protein